MTHDDSRPAVQGRSSSTRHFPILSRWRWWIVSLTVVMLYAGSVIRRWEICAPEAADAAAEEQSYLVRARASDQTATQAMSYQQAADYYGKRKWAFRLALIFPWRSTPPNVYSDPEAAGFLWDLPDAPTPGG